MRASEILSRARAPALSPARPLAVQPPQPAAPVVQSAAQRVEVHPPRIPPTTPPRSGVYRQLMQKHDRMGLRHLT